MTLPEPSDDGRIFGFPPEALRAPTGGTERDAWCAARFAWWREVATRIGVAALAPGGDRAQLAGEVWRFAGVVEADAHPVRKGAERVAELVAGRGTPREIGACLGALRARIDEAQERHVRAAIPARHRVALAGPPADWRSEAVLEGVVFPLLDPRHRLRDVARDVGAGRREWQRARGEVEALLRALEPAERYLTACDASLVDGPRGPRAAAEAVHLDEPDGAARTRALLRVFAAWDAVAERLVGEMVRDAGAAVEAATDDQGGMLDRAAAWVEAQGGRVFSARDVLAAYHGGRAPEVSDPDKAGRRIVSELRDRRGLAIESMVEIRRRGGSSPAAKGYVFSSAKKR